jgi:hypothetical protein
MPQSTFEKFLPASGILAGILFAISGYVAKTPDNASDNPVTAMAGHGAQNTIAFIAAALFAVTIAFFSVAIRSALRSGEPGESTYSSAAFAGGIMVAVVSAINASFTLTLVDLVENKDVASARVVGALGIDGWLMFMAGAAVLLLSTGLGGLRTGALPKWLAIITAVLGVCALLGPAGFLVWFAMPLWCMVTGVVLARRQSMGRAATEVTHAVTA